jgi:hypothetical protein
MTRPTRRAAKKIVTIWPITGSDPYTGTTFGSPYLTNVTFEQGATRQYNDSQGNSFIPASIYWFEFVAADGLPKLNWAIALGDQSIESDPTAVEKVEYIRVAKLQDGGRDVDDVMVLT